MKPLERLQFPRLKLAGTYLAIIMGMSLIFSIAIYNISDRELSGQRQVEVPRNVRVVTLYDEFEKLRQERLEQARANLRERLIVFNLITLLIGAVLSYGLALRALQPIEEAMEAQERFTSDASHEIRTPLTVMKSEIEVALRDQNLTIKEAKDTLNSNLEEITKLESLTNALLQLARHGRSDAQYEKISAQKIMNEAVEQIKPKAAKKKIKIELIKLKDVPISVQPQSLQQALVILLDNAVKYSPKGSTVKIYGNSGRTSYTFKIQDNGQGIDPADLPHIFDRFYRSDKSRTKENETSGYGLGLAIAKQIVDSHSGNIQIASRPNKGTTAKIILPKK